MVCDLFILLLTVTMTNAKPTSLTIVNVYVHAVSQEKLTNGLSRETDVSKIGLLHFSHLLSNSEKNRTRLSKIHFPWH